MSGVDKVAGGGESEKELLRGEGGYNGGTEGGRPGGDANGSGDVRRGGGGYEGGAGSETRDSGNFVQGRIDALEKRIKELEQKAEDSKRSEGGKFELVNVKNMTPTTLKDGTAFRVWREDFERWAGLKVRGLQEILKLIGGRKSWGEELKGMAEKRLKDLG